MNKKPSLQEEIAMANLDRNNMLRPALARTKLHAPMIKAAGDVLVGAKPGNVALARKVLNSEASINVRRLGA